jgi:hypothetical protein
MPRMVLSIRLDAVSEATLQHLVLTPSTPRALAQRSGDILGAAAGHSNQSIGVELGLPAIAVGQCRWAFARHHPRDASRSGRTPKNSPSPASRIR